MSLFGRRTTSEEIVSLEGRVAALEDQVRRMTAEATWSGAKDAGSSVTGTELDGSL